MLTYMQKAVLNVAIIAITYIVWRLKIRVRLPLVLSILIPYFVGAKTI